MKNILSVFFVCTILSTSVFAQEISKAPSEQEILKVREHNEMLNEYYDQFSHSELLRAFQGLAPARPFAEYERNGYVIFNDDGLFDSLEAKEEIAKNLPSDVTLVVFTQDSTKSAKDLFSHFIAESRLKVIQVPSVGIGFWARDALPVPAVLNSGRLRLVDAKYYHDFENDELFATIFGAELVKHNFYYEGGNFMPNKLGDCLMINKEAVGDTIRDDILKSHYGCKKIYRLPYIKGIGHADESVKFISDKIIVTDTAEYKNILSKAGFEVHMLPRPDQSMETYVNSLLVNGTLFMPSFGETNDAAAIKVYQSLGLKVIPLRSNQLSNVGQGSIHCITMNYPPVPFKVIQQALNR